MAEKCCEKGTKCHHNEIILVNQVNSQEMINFLLLRNDSEFKAYISEEKTHHFNQKKNL